MRRERGTRETPRRKKRTEESKGRNVTRRRVYDECAYIERPSFRNLPFRTLYPFMGYCLRSLECAEGACIVRRPSYMHHPPIAVILSESTPSTLYLHSLFCVNPFVLALIFLQFLLRMYARTTSHPFIYSHSTGGDC